MSDFYQTLGVHRNASHDDIRKAFRKLARRYHPDKNPGDLVSEEKFKEANEAHATLSEPTRRKQYDEMLRLGAFDSPADGSRPGPGQRGFDPRSFQRADQTFQMGCFGDILANLFDAAGQNGRRGADLRTDTTVSLEGAFE